MTKAAEFIQKNILTIISAILALSIIFTIGILRDYELDHYGKLSIGRVVECHFIKYSAACIVTVEFSKEDGSIHRESIKLYKKSNCAVGSTLTIEYSTKSDLINVIEHSSN
jgi:hypothetical protein